MSDPVSFTAMVALPKPQGTNHGLVPVRLKTRASIGLSYRVKKWKLKAHSALEPLYPADLALLACSKHVMPLGLGIIYLTDGPLPYTSGDLDGAVKFTQDAIARAWKFNDARVRALAVGQVAFSRDAIFFWLGPKMALPSVFDLELMALNWFTVYTLGA